PEGRTTKASDGTTVAAHPNPHGESEPDPPTPLELPC
ncbi:MAG: hypothetical protein ACI8PZ_000455, partial [Myxococcota bacterium]